jgi:hypothetical protein
MWFEINGVDRTNLVEHDSASGQASTGDPLPTFALTMVDPGAQIPLAVGMPITVWDETTSFLNIGVPAKNLLVNVLLDTSGGWQTGGPNGGVCSFANPYEMSMTFSNDPTAGFGYIQQTTQLGKIFAGQPYMLSVWLTATGTPSGIQAFIQINWLDAEQNYISNTSYFSPIPPTNGTWRFTCSGNAPANAVYAQVQVGAQVTSTPTNNGTLAFYQVQLEPMLFSGQSLSNGTPVSYPTADCDASQTDCVLLPDQTTTRMRWLFNGYIKNLKWSYDGTNRTYVMECASMGDVIDNGAIINENFEATTDQSIINTIISTYFPTTLSSGQQNDWTPHTTVQYGQSISAVAFGDVSFRDILNELADATGFIYFVDPYSYVHYNDTPYDYAPFSVDVDAPDYVTAFPPQNYLVESDGAQLSNSVKVLGGQYYTSSSDPFSGDGHTKDFTLTSIPQNIQNISIGGVTYAPTNSNKIGVYGQDTLGFNNIVVTYDRNSSVVHFYTAPVSGTDNVVITYNTYRNVAVQVEDNASVGQFQGRRFYSKVTDTTIADNTTAQVRGLSEIGKYAYPLPVLTFDLTNLFADRGTTIMVYSALDGFDPLPCVVQQVKLKSLGGGVNVYSYTCGTYRPSMTDAMRNNAKALQANTATSGSTVVQETIEALTDTTYYGEQLSATFTQAASPPAPYDSAVNYEATILADSPLAYYRLDEASGPTAQDSSGNGYNGTYAGSGVTYSEPGALFGSTDSAILLNGTTGEMTCPAGLSPGGLGAISVECWVLFPSVGFAGYATLAANAIPGSSNTGFSLFVAPGAAAVAFAVGNGTTSATAQSNQQLAANTWYYLCGTWDGTTVRLYVNSSAVAASAALSGTLGAAASSVAVGYQPASGSDYVPGSMDEVAIYPTALSALRVQLRPIYGEGALDFTYDTYKNTVLADNPQGYYRLDEASGPTAQDSSGNGYNGTYAGSGVTYSEPGVTTGDGDTAVLLDGTAGEMTCPTGLNPGGWAALTAEAWVKLTSISASAMGIWTNAQPTTSHKGISFHIGPGGTTLIMSIGNGTSAANLSVAYSFATGQWYHLVATWNGSTVTVYINGASVGSVSFAGGTIGSTSTAVGLGYSPVTNSSYLPGEIDEAALYNSALSAARVEAHYLRALYAAPTYGFSSYS